MEINQQTPQDELLAIINDPNTADDVYEKASKEHRRRLLVKKQEAEALEQRISEVVKAVRGLNISFEKFVESKTGEGETAFDVAQIKAYASKKRWIQEISITAESKDLQWVELDNVQQLTHEESMRRMVAKTHQTRHQG